MSKISVNNLSFSYYGNEEKVFENVTFNIDTNWKLGLIGRNGKGKTTFLNLLLDKYEYQGTISKSIDLDYFPFDVDNKNKMAIEIINEIAPQVEDWEIIKEINLLNTNSEILYKNYNLLSGGEQVKILLISLFLKDNNFLLIDEPTNHLDSETKKNLIQYLKNKKSFILVSHDRTFLDEVVDHIISINNTNIEVQSGNYTSWKENFDRQTNYEMKQNEKLNKSISKLEMASKETENWSNKIEKTKSSVYNKTEGTIDKGYIGHQAAKMMKKSKVLEQKMKNEIEAKKSLLNNVDRIDDLKIVPLKNERKSLIYCEVFAIKYNNKEIFKKISFEICDGDRVAFCGKNGVGKSSILKLLVNGNIEYNGILNKVNNLKISYVEQTTENLKGSIKEFSRLNNIEESLFKAMLIKMGFSKDDFDKNLQSLSEGQKKKVLIAKSFSENANIYIWDEPLNYIDIITREQIENSILKYKPTLIFVEHDENFVSNIANKIINLEKV